MKQDKSIQLANHLHHLEEMVELAENPKLLWEEMQILGKKAFTLQEEIEELLNALEIETKEISAIQTLFETREKMWDMMNQLAAAELKLKEKTLTKKETHHKKCCHEKHKCTCHKGGKKCQKK